MIQAISGVPVDAVFVDVDEVQNVVFRVPKRPFAGCQNHVAGDLPDGQAVVVDGAESRGRQAEKREKPVENEFQKKILYYHNG